MERATIRVDGVVQSVGFRPFVYRRATAHDLHGTVRNLGDAGVHIELEGPADAIDGFLHDLREDPPPLSRVETIDVECRVVSKPEFDAFEILASRTDSDSDSDGGTIPPDTTVCEQCLADIHDPESRYHDYWATSCVDCGPRFTVIESLPYDRPTTSMAAFPMCEDCAAEYETPADRRYHAQTIACPQCGPRVRFGRGPGSSAEADSRRSDTATDDTAEGRDEFPGTLVSPTDGRRGVQAAADAIADGEVVVLKGIGGAHLACDAGDDDAVQRLRERTGRPTKPFALMAPDIDSVESFADLSETERTELRSYRRPILLVETADDTPIAPGVAPGLHTVGVMLPYSGVHHLLFGHLDGPVVLTSANLPGRPMLTENHRLVEGLAGVADGFLLHDRRIVARCDDSVARVVDGERRLIRRSRGYAPTPVPLPGTPDELVLGVGPELDVTPAILHAGECYLTQYVGDVDDLDTFAYFEDAINHLLDVTGLDHPPVVAHDEHPTFNTTHYAERLVEGGSATEAVPVQHHHAHAASVLGEHDRDRAIAVTVDGVGYGPDGTVWGGEVLDASRADYERVGGLAPVPMPGGDLATRHPGRLVAGLLHEADVRKSGPPSPERLESKLTRLGVGFPDGVEERALVCQQLDAGVNTPTTSSAGRFLDAVSALLDICTERTYEGEPAMKLEAAAAGGTPGELDVPRTTVANGRPVVDTPRVFGVLVDRLADGAPAADVAATAQEAVAVGLADLAVETAREREQNAVVLSGGVAYNDHIARRIRERVTRADLEFLTNQRVPAGDGGIGYGQVTVVAALLD